jgi:methylenetetrahydrofolate--tRNA-(uracil-5-)-methyltransferase
VTQALEASPNIRICREEVMAVPSGAVCVLATGPLTGDALARSIQDLTGEDNLSFFDALNPIVEGDSVDMSKSFAASRYGKGGADFLNCPLTRDEYLRFHAALLDAETHGGHDFDACEFLGCPPLERLARSGVDTLRFGPMRPVGLKDPSTGREPYAVVQLRRENLRSDSFNIVGFQNQMKWNEQKRVLGMIPALAHAEFVRFGQMHRNTYLRAPRLLTPALNLRTHPDLFIAGQLCGVEGYVESVATGLIAGLNAWRRSLHEPPIVFPRPSGLGSICHYLAHADADDFAPVRLTFDLLPPIDCATDRAARNRQVRRERQCAAALAALAPLVSVVPRHAAALSL